MRLGEGTGAVLAMTLIEGAVRVFNEVMTFAEAGMAR
jgi:nicotinate-nucleotide--dimethylbenzimidazole phosphoribosyltransferase